MRNLVPITRPIATNAQIGHFIADWSQTAAG